MPILVGSGPATQVRLFESVSTFPHCKPCPPKASSVKPVETLSIVDTAQGDLVSGKRKKTRDKTKAAVSKSALPRKNGAPGKGNLAELDVK